MNFLFFWINLTGEKGQFFVEGRKLMTLESRDSLKAFHQSNFLINSSGGKDATFNQFVRLFDW